MTAIVFFDPLHTEGAVLGATFDSAFRNGHVRCYPPEPVSRGKQVERAAARIWLGGFTAQSINYYAPIETQPADRDGASTGPCSQVDIRFT
jgi:hypothetical protein